MKERAMQIELAYKSSIGSREEQEDAYFANSSGDKAFAVVCDGMGGTKGGAAASNAAVNRLRKLIETKNRAEPYPSFFLRALDIIDEEIVTLQRNEETAKAGTTVVAVVIEDAYLYWLAVGDSRLYIIRGNEIVQATRDHNYALSVEQWTAEERAAGPAAVKHRTDALISFIGIGGVKIYDINEAAFSLKDNDLILLTTDGLTNTLSNEEIMAALKRKSISENLDILFKKAEEKPNGLQDNTTCVLIKIKTGGSKSGKEKSSMP
jgi:protein phosphatase